MAWLNMNSGQTERKNLIEFKAGKMILRQSEGMVYPDSRKGLVYIHQGVDLMIHFCWKDRSSNSNKPEDDLVIFPDEVDFKKVTQNTTGRIYILKWKTNSKKLFFWMQEPKDDKDDEICQKVNDTLNQVSTTGFSDESGSESLLALQPLLEQMTRGGLNSAQFNSLLQNIRPNDLASLLASFGSTNGSGIGFSQGTPRVGTSTERTSNMYRTDLAARPTAGSRPNTAPAATRSTATSNASTRSTIGGTRPVTLSTSTTSSSAKPAVNNTDNTTNSSSKPKPIPIQLTSLTNAVMNLTSNASMNADTSNSSVTSMSDSISNPEDFVQILSNKDVQEHLRSLLPTGWTLPNNEEECREKINSDAFRQALNAFCYIVQSRRLGSLLMGFNFPNDVLESVNQADINALARALEKHYKNEKEKSMDTN